MWQKPQASDLSTDMSRMRPKPIQACGLKWPKTPKRHKLIQDNKLAKLGTPRQFQPVRTNIWAVPGTPSNFGQFHFYSPKEPTEAQIWAKSPKTAKKAMSPITNNTWELSETSGPTHGLAQTYANTWTEPNPPIEQFRTLELAKSPKTPKIPNLGAGVTQNSPCTLPGAVEAPHRYYHMYGKTWAKLKASGVGNAKDYSMRRLKLGYKCPTKTRYYRYHKNTRKQQQKSRCPRSKNSSKKRSSKNSSNRH